MITRGIRFWLKSPYIYVRILILLLGSFTFYQVVKYAQRHSELKPISIASEPEIPLKIQEKLKDGYKIDRGFIRIMHLEENDPPLLNYLKRYLIHDPIYGQEYNFECGHPICGINTSSSSSGMDKNSPTRDLELEKFKALSQRVLDLLGQKGNGFFVEYRRESDGENLSQTLYLEKDHGWSGLIIQPDFEMFHKLKKKGRKAFVSNTCISGKFRPEISYDEKPPHQTYCFTLSSYFLALGIQKVDFLSIDTRKNSQSVDPDSEFEIVKKLFYSGVTISIISIEVSHLSKKKLIKFMHAIDYSLISKTKYLTFYDYLFVRKEK